MTETTKKVKVRSQHVRVYSGWFGSEPVLQKSLGGLRECVIASPSDLEAGSGCRRKLWFRRASGSVFKPSASAELGERVHLVIEFYLLTGVLPTEKQYAFLTALLPHNVPQWAVTPELRSGLPQRYEALSPLARIKCLRPDQRLAIAEWYLEKSKNGRTPRRDMDRVMRIVRPPIEDFSLLRIPDPSCLKRSAIGTPDSRGVVRHYVGVESQVDWVAQFNGLVEVLLQNPGMLSGDDGYSECLSDKRINDLQLDTAITALEDAGTNWTHVVVPMRMDLMEILEDRNGRIVTQVTDWKTTYVSENVVTDWGLSADIKMLVYAVASIDIARSMGITPEGAYVKLAYFPTSGKADYCQSRYFFSLRELSELVTQRLVPLLVSTIIEYGMWARKSISSKDAYRARKRGDKERELAEAEGPTTTFKVGSKTVRPVVRDFESSFDRWLGVMQELVPGNPKACRRKHRCPYLDVCSIGRRDESMPMSVLNELFDQYGEPGEV